MSVRSRTSTACLPCTDELPQAERPAQDAHIRVHAHEQDVVDAPALQQVPDLDARVADGVLVADLDGRDLLPPGRALRARRAVVAAAVGLIDAGRPPSPRRGSCCTSRRCRRAGSRPSGRTGALPGGMVLVGVHATARGVDDEHPPGPRGGDRPVHRGRQLADATRRTPAPVLVPHVADDDRRLRPDPTGAPPPGPGSRTMCPSRRRSGIGAHPRMQHQGSRAAEARARPRPPGIRRSPKPKIQMNPTHLRHQVFGIGTILLERGHPPADRRCSTPAE